MPGEEIWGEEIKVLSDNAGLQHLSFASSGNMRIWCRAGAENHRQHCDQRGRLHRAYGWRSRLADETAGSKGLLRAAGIFALGRCQDSRSQKLRLGRKHGRERL